MARTNKEISEEMRALEKERVANIEKEQNEEAAKRLKGVYDSYITAGFTEQQAWEITMTLLGKQMKQ